MVGEILLTRIYKLHKIYRYTWDPIKLRTLPMCKLMPGKNFPQSGFQNLWRFQTNPFSECDFFGIRKKGSKAEILIYFTFFPWHLWHQKKQASNIYVHECHSVSKPYHCEAPTPNSFHLCSLRPSQFPPDSPPAGAWSLPAESWSRRSKALEARAWAPVVAGLSTAWGQKSRWEFNASWVILLHTFWSLKSNIQQETDSNQGQVAHYPNPVGVSLIALQTCPSTWGTRGYEIVNPKPHNSIGQPSQISIQSMMQKFML